MRFQVSSIPMLVVFKDGKAVAKSVGYRPKSEIAAMGGGRKMKVVDRGRWAGGASAAACIRLFDEHAQIMIERSGYVLCQLRPAVLCRAV